MRLSYLFYGAPAMDMQQFRSNPSRRVIGASLKVDMPLGDYNNENLINTGSNRWTFKPEIGISNRWGSRLSVEAALADGVLRLTLPKVEKATPRKITVTAG